MIGIASSTTPETCYHRPRALYGFRATFTGKFASRRRGISENADAVLISQNDVAIKAVIDSSMNQERMPK